MMKRALSAVCFILLLTIFTSNIKAEEISKVFSRVNRNDKKIALTFDDGPHPRYTKRILDILRRHNVKATFFTIGVNIDNYTDAFENILFDGHEVGNHTFSHKINVRDKEVIIEEIEKCERAIMSKNGTKPALLRPPRGEYSEELTEIASNMGYSVILWSIDTRDWEHCPAAIIAKNVIKSIKGGDIILMHDYISGENTTCTALEIMIPYLQSQGYEFVTVSELLKT